MDRWASPRSTCEGKPTEPFQRAQFRSSHKSEIKRAQRSGLVVIEDTRKEHLGRFGEIYTENMRRVGAADHCFFDHAYFEDLAARLGPALRLFVVLAGEEVACAALFIVCDGIIQYHLCGTSAEHLQLAPMKLLVDTVRLWGTERGHKVLHLGGGVGAQEDSLFRFKSGFSDRRHDFFLWRWMLDPLAYDSLCGKKERWNEANELRPASAAYFPAYRAPVLPLAHAVA